MTTAPRITVDPENKTVTFEPGYYRFTRKTVFAAPPRRVIKTVSVSAQTGGGLDVDVDIWPSVQGEDTEAKA